MSPAKPKPHQSDEATVKVGPKYPHPKILLIDLDNKTRSALEKEGFNVVTGSFGQPYKVEKSSEYVPVLLNADLPQYSEQEIVVINLDCAISSENPSSEKTKPMQELDWWAKASEGFIDPRPVVMLTATDYLDRIYHFGGIFVIFSQLRFTQDLVWAKITNGGRFHIDSKENLDNWGFLSILSNLNITTDPGKEIEAECGFAKEFLSNASFSCTMEPLREIRSRWQTFAINKFSSAVAGCISPSEDAQKGWVFIFPQISDQAEFLLTFLKDELPKLAPELFPHNTGQKWVHDIAYELPKVLEKRDAIRELEEATAREVHQLEKAIKEDQQANSYMYDLLRETGTPLVEATTKALRGLGFQNIVNVDEEMRQAKNAAMLREDLRIHEIDRVLIVDIKGVAGKPGDAEATQSLKHVNVYMRENRGIDVRGLTIVNHQRQHAPLDRENNKPFRKEILDNALEMHFGLMTTWDLFRLVRGFQRNSWRPEDVKPLFFEIGRIFPIPKHYKLVGKIRKVWNSAFSVIIEHEELHVGGGLSIETPVDFVEMPVTSLMLKNVAVMKASTGDEVGISRDQAGPKIKEGMPVYSIEAK